MQPTIIWNQSNCIVTVAVARVILLPNAFNTHSHTLDAVNWQAVTFVALARRQKQS